MAEFTLLLEVGRYEAAHPVALRALSEAERFGPNHPRVGQTWNKIGLLYRLMGRQQEAENAYLRAIRILESDAGGRMEFTNTLHNLASLYMEYGNRYSEAERMMRRALAEGLGRLGPDHPDVAAMIANLASAAMMQRRYREASGLYQQALAILEKSPAVHRPNLAGILSNLGYLEYQQRNPLGAVDYLTRSVSVYTQTLGPDHPEVITPLLNLARTYLALERPAMAQDSAQRAVAIAGSVLGTTHPRLEDALSTYSIVLRKSGMKKQARQAELQAKAIRAANPRLASSMTVHISDLENRSKR